MGKSCKDNAIPKEKHLQYPKPARKVYYHDIYRKITPVDRLNVIYSRQVHNMSLYDITHQFGIKYNTVRNIINTYVNTGRTNKKRYRKPDNTILPANDQIMEAPHPNQHALAPQGSILGN